MFEISERKASSKSDVFVFLLLLSFWADQARREVGPDLDPQLYGALVVTIIPEKSANDKKDSKE